MSLDVVLVALLAGALVALAAAGCHFAAALGEMRRHPPASPRDGSTTLRQMMSASIWEPSVPASARHSYLLCHLDSVAASAFVATLLFMESMPLLAAASGVVCVAAIGVTVRSWCRYRAGNAGAGLNLPAK